MKKTVEILVEHPIASTIVIGSIARGIASIVIAARGGTVQPVVVINKAAEKASASVEV